MYVAPICDGNSLHKFYIPYSRMLRLNEIFCGTVYGEATSIDIYIDMNSMTSQLFYSSGSITGGAEEIASTIINLCAHYRTYYNTRHHVSTRFFIVYSPNRPSYCVERFDEYNSKHTMRCIVNAPVNDMVNKACVLLHDLAPYLPDIFFLCHANHEVSTLIADSIIKEDKPYPALVISRDPLTYELTAISPKVHIVIPRKTKGVDTSRIVNSQSVMAIIMSEAMNHSMPQYRSLSAGLIPLIYTLNGLDRRSIPMWLNASDTFRVINDAVIYGVIPNVHIEDELIGEYYGLLSIDKFGIPKEEFCDRYKALDIFRGIRILQQEEFISGDLEYKQQTVNIYDPNRVKTINNTVYAHCPLMLEKL